MNENSIFNLFYLNPDWINNATSRIKNTSSIRSKSTNNRASTSLLQQQFGTIQPSSSISTTVVGSISMGGSQLNLSSSQPGKFVKVKITTHIDCLLLSSTFIIN